MLRNALVTVCACLSLSAAGFPEPVPCGGGVDVLLTATSLRQGQLCLVELRSREPLREIKGGAAGHDLHFWEAADQESTYRALLGIDLNAKPASYPLAISTTFADGQKVGCSLALSVSEGDFLVERLDVDYKYVELAPKDLARARRESRRQRRIFDTVTPERLWQGSFQPPLPGVKGSGNFGKRRIFNGEPRSPHSGEDFPAPAGTPIHAPQRGRVVLAEELFFSGNAVILDHGLGLYTFFGHMNSIAVAVGDVVEKGAVLGRVGATGRVTGPHLHYTVRLNQARVNPADLLVLFP